MKKSDASSAHLIAKDIVAKKGRALETGKFEDYADCFALPLALSDFSLSRALSDPTDLRDLFVQVRLAFVEAGLTRINRYFGEVIYVNATEIKSMHTCELLQGNALLQAPFPVLTGMKMSGDGQWRITEIQYATQSFCFHNETFLDPDHSPEDRRLWGEFDQVLDQQTLALIGDNLEMLLHRTKLPLYKQGKFGALQYETRADVAEELRMYQREFAILGVTDIVRKVRRVRRNGPKQLVGDFSNYILSGQTLVMPSFESSMHVELCDDGIWRATKILSGLGRLLPPDDAQGENTISAPFKMTISDAPIARADQTTGEHDG